MQARDDLSKFYTELNKLGNSSKQDESKEIEPILKDSFQPRDKGKMYLVNNLLKLFVEFI